MNDLLTVFKDGNFSSLDGFLAAVGHLFLFSTSLLLINWVVQSTDVMFAILFLIKTSKRLSRIFISAS